MICHVLHSMCFWKLKHNLTCCMISSFCHNKYNLGHYHAFYAKHLVIYSLTRTSRKSQHVSLFYLFLDTYLSLYYKDLDHPQQLYCLNPHSVSHKIWKGFHKDNSFRFCVWNYKKQYCPEKKPSKVRPP